MSELEVAGKGSVQVGRATSIGIGAQVVFSKPGRISIGDYCVIGAGVKIVCSGGDVHIGDWSTLHDNCLVLSTKYVDIGEHCWFGQNCIIDGTGGLKIDRGVRVGMYSQIWSHVAAGEQIEGCILFGERPVHIENDVWLVGSCIVASGVTLGRRIVALIGSNITKSFPENTVLAGTPASAKPGLSFYQNVTSNEKWNLLRKWVEAGSKEMRLKITTVEDEQLHLSNDRGESIVFVAASHQAKSIRTRNPAVTVCCIEDKTYNKQFTVIEKQVLKYLAGNKARFYDVSTTRSATTN